MAEPVINIVLVGRTGNGKSATGNTLLGQKLFVSRRQEGGVTMKCQMYRAAIQDGPIINVIDTPGLCDLSVSSDYINKEIIKCLNMAEKGIHAVLFVLSVMNPISQEEESTFYSLQRIFDGKIVDYIIIVFTGGDELRKDGQTLDDYLRDGCPEFMARIFRLSGRRKILFDNKTRDKDTKAAQLKQLMSHVADVGKQTGGKPYAHNWHHKIKEENGKIREKQKEIECKNITEAEAAQMMERLRIPREETMRTIAHMAEIMLKHSAETHQREISQLKETMQQGQRQIHRNPMMFPLPYTPNWQDSFTEPVINIVLIGRTGSGKSATGNTLLGQKLFTFSRYPRRPRRECKMFRTTKQDGPVFNIINTHDLFDFSVPAEYISREIINFLTMAEEGIHVVLFVLSVKTRISQEEESTLDSLQCIFESKILDYIIVVFTGGDELEAEELTLDSYLGEGCPECLVRVLRLCGGRKVLFDNKTKDKDKKAAQFKQLLAHIEDVGRQTGGKPYIDNMLRMIKEKNDKLREKEKEIESKNHAETDAIGMMESLQIEHEETMRMMAQMVESNLKQITETHQRE